MERGFRMTPKGRSPGIPQPSSNTEVVPGRMTYLRGTEENLHALSCQEGLPARPEGGDVLEAEQKHTADRYVGAGGVVLVPVLVEPEQAGDVASVHRPAAVRL